MNPGGRFSILISAVGTTGRHLALRLGRAGLQRPRALVVGGDPTSRLVVAEMLRRTGLMPQAVARGRDGLAALVPADAGAPPALVLLDDVLPDLEVDAFLEEMRRTPRLATVPVILVTDAPDAPVPRGVTPLGRPVRQAALARAVRDALDPAAAPSAHPAGDRRLRVLVADDDPVHREVARHLLERAGHVVVTAATGEAAVALCARARIDLVLMDVQLPDLDGVAATARIRAHGLRVPIVALTARATPADRDRCLAAGMDGYLPKPIDPGDLDRTLAALGSASPAPPPDGPPDVDPDALLARVAGDMALLRKLIGLFVEQSGHLLDDGRRAIERGDAPALDAAAHALKSVVGHFSTGDAFRHAGAIEASARAGDLVDAGDRWRTLEDDVRRLRTQLDRLGPRDVVPE